MTIMRCGSAPAASAASRLTDSPLNERMLHLVNLESSDCRRMLVLEVTDAQPQLIDAASNTFVFELRLRLFSERDESEVLCQLRDDWAKCRVNVGDYVNIIGKSEANGSFLVTKQQNMMIVHPDTLLSGTRVGESFSCTRKSVLTERVQDSTSNLAALRGTMAHELFQNCLKANMFSPKFIRSLVSDTVKSRYIDLASLPETEESHIEYLCSLIPEMSSWQRRFMFQPPKKENVLSYSNTQFSTSIVEVADIEENIWSPMFGLKGRIDATVKVVRHDLKTSSGQRKPNRVAELVPLEIKSGGSNASSAVSHRAQLSLYTLLLSDRHSQDIDIGLLYYLKDGVVCGVRPDNGEKMSLLSKRNLLASYLVELQQHPGCAKLPPMLSDNERACRYCYVNNSCMLYHKACEGDTPLSSGLSELYEKLIDHLDENECRYFMLWDRLLELEAREPFVSRAGVWTLGSKERELQGKCAGGLMMAAFYEPQPSVCIYTFKRNHCIGEDEKHRSLLSLQISPHDLVVISSECGKVALTLGTVVSIGNSEIVVRTFNRLQPSVYKLLFRIDRDEFSSSFTRLRSELVSLFSSEELDTVVRQRVVGLRAPSFSSAKEREFVGRLSHPLKMQFQHQLNRDQRRAVLRAYAAEDYSLVLGMPGTGKSSLIVFCIRALNYIGKSVLVCAHTNSAVDNILLKLKEHEDTPFIRVGNPDQVHCQLKEFLLSASNVKNMFNSLNELREFIGSHNVIATTCLSVGNSLLKGRTFDVCIVDEASQVTQIVILGALRRARSFVLVGDHYQLPPLVRDADANEGGMNVSMFLRLSQAHPSSVSQLRFQYRMNEHVLELCNELVYNNALVCGSVSVANQRLSVPHLERLLTPSVGKSSPEREWLKRLFLPSESVVFFDTDMVPAPEHRDSAKGLGIQNPVEAALVSLIVNAFVSVGVDIASIGVLSLYRAQLKLLRRLLAQHNQQQEQSCLDIDTVDKFQGRDKHVIVISLVRSNDFNLLGSLLTDWRRINVAVSRARCKLVIVGSAKTVTAAPTTGALLRIIRRKHGVHTLPLDAHLLYGRTKGSMLLPAPQSGERSILRQPRTDKKFKAERIVGGKKQKTEHPKLSVLRTTTG